MIASIRSYCRQFVISSAIVALFTGCATAPVVELPKKVEEKPAFTGLTIEQGPTSLGCEPRRQPVTILVLHHTAGSLPSSLETLQGKDPKHRVGVHYVVTDEAKHDEIVAAISHVPHAAASALMLAVMDQPGFRRFAVGAGLRDTTRIAAGEENLWVGIMLANARHTAAGLRDVEKRAAELRAAVEANDAVALRRLLAEARIARQNLDRPE